MDWQTIKRTIYFNDGAFRDILVPRINRNDWKKWVDYVSANYKVSTREDETQTTKELIDFNYISNYWDGKIEHGATTSVNVGGVIVNAHYCDAKNFENDIIPNEVTSLKHHEAIVRYMTDISKLFNKKVILTMNNSPEIIFITVNQDIVVLTEKQNK